jgi:hypothetical protein
MLLFQWRLSGSSHRRVCVPSKKQTICQQPRLRVRASLSA